MHPLDVIGKPSRRSAAVVVPILTDLVAPKSVLDVGCGTGAWGAAFAPTPVLGLDVHPPADVASNYQQHDLAEPFDVGWFDLALCLEVAEHITAERVTGSTGSLVHAPAPVVAFSEAIPGQPGHGHVNCQ